MDNMLKAEPCIEILSYDGLRDLAIELFGYTELCQHVYDLCIDREYQCVRAEDVMLIPMSTCVRYFDAACDVHSEKRPRMRQGFVVGKSIERGTVTLSAGCRRAWRVKVSGRRWLMKLKAMHVLEREVQSKIGEGDGGGDSES